MIVKPLDYFRCIEPLREEPVAIARSLVNSYNSWSKIFEDREPLYSEPTRDIYVARQLFMSNLQQLNQALQSIPREPGCTALDPFLERLQKCMDQCTTYREGIDYELKVLLEELPDYLKVMKLPPDDPDEISSYGDREQDYIESIKRKAQIYLDELEPESSGRRIAELQTKEIEQSWGRLNTANARLTAFDDFHIIWLTGKTDISDKPIPNKSELYFHLKDITPESEADLRCAEEIIYRAYKNAINFLQVNSDEPTGCIIQGDRSFIMEKGDHLGIKVNYKTVEGLIDAIQNNDCKRIRFYKDYFESWFVHEKVHRLRNDIAIDFSSGVKSEIASHAVQILHNKIVDPNTLEHFRYAINCRDITRHYYLVAIEFSFKVVQAALIASGYEKLVPDFKPDTIRAAINIIQTTPRGKELLSALALKIRNTEANDLIKEARKVKDAKPELIFTEGDIEILKDSYLSHPAMVIKSIGVDNSIKTKRIIKLNNDIAEALMSKVHPHHAEALRVLSNAIAVSKLQVTIPIGNDGEIMLPEIYAASRINRELKIIPKHAVQVPEFLTDVKEARSFLTNPGILTFPRASLLANDYERNTSVGYEILLERSYLF